MLILVKNENAQEQRTFPTPRHRNVSPWRPEETVSQKEFHGFVLFRTLCFLSFLYFYLFSFPRLPPPLTCVPELLVPVHGEDDQQVPQDVHHDGEDEEAAQSCGDPGRAAEQRVWRGAVQVGPIYNHCSRSLNFWGFSPKSTRRGSQPLSPPRRASPPPSAWMSEPLVVVVVLVAYYHSLLLLSSSSSPLLPSFFFFFLLLFFFLFLLSSSVQLR